MTAKSKRERAYRACLQILSEDRHLSASMTELTQVIGYIQR